jgi:hypothetical protein
MQLRALDNFTASIPSFKGETPIPAVTILTQTPSAESAGDSLKGHSAKSSMTQAGKRKVVATLPPPKKTQKVMGKKASGVKINDPAHKSSPSLTPPRRTCVGLPCTDPTGTFEFIFLSIIHLC